MAAGTGLVQQREASIKAAQEAQRKAERQAATDRFIALENPTAQDYLELSAANPEMGEKLKASFEMKTAEEQKNLISMGTSAMMVAQANRPDLVAERLEAIKEYAEGKNDKPLADTAEALLYTNERNPEKAKKDLTFLNAFMNPDFASNYGKAVETLQEQELQPFEVRAKKAEVKKAERTAEQEARDEALIAGAKAQATAPYKSSTQFTVNPDGSVTYSQGVPASAGRSPLTSTVQKDIQKDVVGGIETIDSLSRIKGLYKPEFLTYPGKVAAEGRRQLEKLGFEGVGKKQIKEISKFKSNVQQFFNQYKKEITGAAAGVKEMEDIKESIIALEDSPSEFEAKLQEMEEKAKRGLRIKQMILREGVPLGSPDFKEMHNEIYKAGEDDDPLLRAKDLSPQYMKRFKGNKEKAKEAIRQRLITEGYL